MGGLLVQLSIAFVGLVSQVKAVGLPRNILDSLRATEWGYEASNGPDTWAANFADFCAGMSQSPINIDMSTVVTPITDPGPITFTNYDTAMSGQVTNNGHTAKFTFTAGTAPTISGGRLPTGNTFEFAQLHWHWGSVSTQGSEHTLDGVKYPMEIHLVHWNKKYGTIADALNYSDGLAVLGFFYEVSTADNGDLKSILDKFADVDNVARKIRKKNKNKKKGVRTGRVGAELTSDQRVDVSVPIPSDMKLNQFLPSTGAGDQYTYYQGSLTTPTCNEIVLWTVFTNKILISESQLAKFRTLKDSDGTVIQDNFRPPQPLNGRTVYLRKGTATVADTSAANLSVGAAIGAATMYFIYGFGLLPTPQVTRRSYNNIHPGFKEQYLQAPYSS